MPKRTRSKAKKPRSKPKKPHPKFPLTAHRNGQWCKKIRGKIHFFGVWSDPDAALDNYHRNAAALHAGQSIVVAREDEFTLKELGNEYLAYQMERVNGGQIGLRWFEDCRRVVRHFVKALGTTRDPASLTPTDFQRYRKVLTTKGLTGKRPLGVYGMTRTITVVRNLFKWAVDTGMLEQQPRWGTGFAKPSAAEVRRSKAEREREHGKRVFAAEQVHALINCAEGELKAAILLGINGGFGNTDCAALPIAALDLDDALIDFERPKTAVRRVVPLWPETIAALRSVLAAERAEPRDERSAKLVLRTEQGRPLVRQRVKRMDDDSIKAVTYIDRLGDWFDQLLDELALKRRGIGFYTLRHTFRTWADEAGDQHAIMRIMGHAIPGMSGVYIEDISLERLRRVAEHVRQKIWAEGNTAKPA